MKRPLIVDGGLATGLEERGHTLHPGLWSAGVFLEDPGAVEALHLAYLESGADVLITASYQMSFAGLAREGLTRAEAASAMRRTVEVADRARIRHGKPALIAASVGPYGATLADGSEYRGDYGLTVDELVEFHRERIDVLSGSGADLLAAETIPSHREALAIRELLSERRDVRAWVSFTCRDGRRLRDGSEIETAAGLYDDCDAVAAVGVNCTAPGHVTSLMSAIRRGTGKPIVVYPNSGEGWNARDRRWSGSFAREGFLASVREWAGKGAWAIGGCCRVGPGLIREIATILDTERFDQSTAPSDPM